MCAVHKNAFALVSHPTLSFALRALAIRAPPTAGWIERTLYPPLAALLVSWTLMGYFVNIGFQLAKRRMPAIASWSLQPLGSLPSTALFSLVSVFC
jgi:hypothetical protein